ncbi:MAG: ribonuclease R, partial [Caulobacteraceae bacterium]|nr:ribonuclease R [Caulobacteraceae bacterium]
MSRSPPRRGPPRGGRGRRPPSPSRALPPVGVADVAERDADGELWVRPAKAVDAAPLIRLAPGDGAARAPGLGDRLLVRFETLETGETLARLFKRLGQSTHRILGVVRKARGEVRVEPVDRRS